MQEILTYICLALAVGFWLENSSGRKKLIKMVAEIIAIANKISWHYFCSNCENFLC
jgi:hypothetical protein